MPAQLYDLAIHDPNRTEIALCNLTRDILKDNLLGAIVICAKHFSPGLHTVKLTNCDIHADRAKLLGEQIILQQLSIQCLDLAKNTIKDEGL